MSVVKVERIAPDPCLVDGLLVAAEFEGRGYIVRRGFLRHPRVLRWLAKHANLAGDIDVQAYPDQDFERLAKDALYGGHATQLH